MKWIDDIKYKLWWRGIYTKDLLVVAVFTTTLVCAVAFFIYALVLSL